MQLLKITVVAAVCVYLGLLLLLYFAQRGMMYIPDRRAFTPADAGLPQARLVEARSEDGETIRLWYAPPQPGRALIVYFHGNAGSIANRADRLRFLMQRGEGVLGVSYRGYGGSSGSPSEAGLIADARAAYAFARAQGHAPDTILLFGESLGSGVAVALAAEQKVAGLVLEAPFSSAADIGASVYWMFPVRALMKDAFDSMQRIGRASAPLLIVHGDADRVVPIRFGKRLFAAANEPKEFVAIAGGGHQVLDDRQVGERLFDWIAARLP